MTHTIKFRYMYFFVCISQQNKMNLIGESKRLVSCFHDSSISTRYKFIG